MKRAALLVAALAFLASAAPAQARLLVSHRAAAVAARFDVPLPPGDVTVLRGVVCPDVPDAACADTYRGIIYLPPDRGHAIDRFDLAHELGHFYDDRVLTDRDRARFTVLLGVPGVPWDGGQRTGLDCGPRDCPAELFADAYAACALHLVPDDGAWLRWIPGGYELTYSYGSTPSKRHLATLCQALRFLALQPTPN